MLQLTIVMRNMGPAVKPDYLWHLEIKLSMGLLYYCMGSGIICFDVFDVQIIFNILCYFRLSQDNQRLWK